MNFIECIPNIASSFEFSKGEIVLLHFWGDNKDLDILDRLAIEIGKSGAVPLKLQQSREFIKDYYSAIDEDLLVMPDKYFDIFKIADSVIDIHTYPVPAPHKDFPREKIGAYRENLMKTMRALMPDKKYFIQLRVPTEDNAASTNLPFDEYYDRMMSALDIDYKKLKEVTNTTVEKFDGVKTVEITTSSDVLSFDITGRPWHRDDGNGDLPCGEVYIAPIEATVNGNITIPKVYLEGELLENVVLDFENGELVKTNSLELYSFVSQIPGDAKMFAEFGIGLNENVKNLCGYELLDEKAIGTMHIAIGMNNMFGGNNDSPFHMDFVFKPDKVLIDGKLYN